MASVTAPETTATSGLSTIKEIYGVSRLVREARAALEGSFPLLWVEGELSNLAMPGSGHVYFTLKDELAQVRCAMFRNRNRQLRFTPKNGMHVLLRVRVSLYEGRGEFQLLVEHMEEAGSGALQRAYEALKYRLGEQGLFDQINKKVLPIFPRTIGIVSSIDGAAVHDILTVLKRRCPAVNIVIYPVAVQGKDAAHQIANAIMIADQRNECDVLIVGRGGGSLEDLWSFNEEKVAHAIYDCQIPIISAVGHEIDFSIADFVADVRAPTPSAAAEMAVPDWQQWLSKLNNHCHRMTLLMRHRLQNERRHLKHLQRNLVHPQHNIRQQKLRVEQLTRQLTRSWKNRLNNERQRLDYWMIRLKHPRAILEKQSYKVAHIQSRLQQCFRRTLDKKYKNINRLSQQLQLVSPLPVITRQQNHLGQLQQQLNHAIQQQLYKKASQLDQNIRTLNAVSPLNTLERGYSITTLEDTGNVLRNSIDVQPKQQIRVRLHKGQIMCEVKQIQHD